MWWCYALRSVVDGRTYVGSTNDPARRLRQHNGWLSGGARATSTSRPWRFLYLMTAVDGCGDAHAAFDHVTALSMEWHLKRRPRGVVGRGRGPAAACGGPRPAKHAHRFAAMARAMARPAVAALGASWVVWAAPEHLDDAWAALCDLPACPCVLPLEADADAPESALAIDALAAAPTSLTQLTEAGARPRSWAAPARTRRSGRPTRTGSPPASGRGDRGRRRTRRSRGSRAT